MITIYVLCSLTYDKKYAGITTDLTRRLKEHNSKKTKFTASFAPWKVIYPESANDYIEARKRENILNQLPEGDQEPHLFTCTRYEIRKEIMEIHQTSN